MWCVYENSIGYRGFQTNNSAGNGGGGEVKFNVHFFVSTKKRTKESDPKLCFCCSGFAIPNPILKEFIILLHHKKIFITFEADKQLIL